MQYASVQYSILYNEFIDLQKEFYPYYGYPLEEQWTSTTAITGWTSGFFPGVYWNIVQYNATRQALQRAIDVTLPTAAFANSTSPYNAGFIIMSGFGNAYRLLKIKEYLDIVIIGAHSLATQYSSIVRCLRSVDSQQGYLVYIDNMMNLELLFEVSNQTKDQYLYDIAWQHANRTMYEHFRDDNSTYHVIEYDETDGNVIRKYTVQGYADWSTWSRGQSWAIFGFTIAYRYTKYQPFLDKAIGATNYVLSHLLNPNDLIPFWDYDALNNSKLSYQPKDTSAAAIFASALIELSQYVSIPDLKNHYLSNAESIINQLSTPKYLIYGDKQYKLSALLANGTIGPYPKNPYDVSLSFGDYYLTQAIIRQQRQSCRLRWAESSWTRWIQIPLFLWVSPILSLANKRTLVEDDLNDLADKEKCSILLNRVNQHSSKWPGTWDVFVKIFYKDFLTSMLLVFLFSITRIAQPLLIRQMVLYIKDQSGLPSYLGYLYAIALCIAAIVQAITQQQIIFRNVRIGVRARNALSSAIYKHLLTINTAALHKTTAAQTINLVSNDANKFAELSIFVHALLMVPLDSLAMFGLIWWTIGLPTIFGYSVLFLLIPIQFIFSRQFSQYRKASMACTDKRVQTINEIVNGCQIIKMYTWEKAMEQRVLETRLQEVSNVRKASSLRALNVAMAFVASPLISLATFGGSWLMGHTLLPENVFSTLSFFGMVRLPLTITMPYLIEKFSEARISAKRIDKFMQLDVLQNRSEKMKNRNDAYAIMMENASFSWKDAPSLSSLNLTIKHGNLIGVKGAIGAGKSTLLAAILGEINLVSGKSQVNATSISYAPQSAWIFADTVRANILLGKPLDEERYNNVIKACCLDIDLQNFGETGDLLMIGDKGVNLSGGQKARISLARALYADADLYLLDDPLAAVDPKVAKSIFDQCIGPYSLLRGKTRILVTHQTHFLIETDQMFLVENGHIEELNIEQHTTIQPSNETLETDPSDNKETDWKLDTSITDINSIVTSEKSADGSIKWKVWLELFTAPPLRWFGFVLMIIIIFGNEALHDFTNSWLARWSSKDETEQQSSFYINVYLGVIFATLFVAVIRVGFIIYIMLCGSTHFHNRMLNGILYTSLRFFENNPSGRILNRASKDQQVVDEALPLALIDTMQCLLLSLGSIVVVGIANPWVLFILIPLTPAVFWLRRFYMSSSRQLKRLESVTRSPVYTLFSTSLDGLTSIRAFNVQDSFLNMFIERIDANTRAAFILSATTHWFGLRLDLIASSLTLITGILAVALRHQIDPSTLALSLSYCITLTGLFQWGIRQSAEAENFMTSAERIHEYGQLVSESHQNNGDNNVPIQPDKDWPSRGIIEFKDYTFRYRPELDPVLKNLNLRIESKEKIGIIGRTGAGKSSLLQALFRLVDQSAVNGSILIDDIDIGRLSLNYLRSRISVIPQVPILFCGSLRYNIDPFKQFTDEECLTALEAVQLKSLVRNHHDGIHLLVAESGANLSAGERQLICVARAILKKSHILLIDEATANVDYATDKMIQEVIADKFRDRTILTIAHRLNTVANSDRILMLEQGEVAHFDSPSNINLI
ncbi:unnamed protein product [Adineta steineri]|uniref:Uncharacterized protein n=1 Tax=Adineta steineri TaxID=433720 RepID=A0A815GV13_9BILA|nr:unnamed protein product [Adineta steineri]